MNYKIQYFCVSHLGLCRSMNQDNLVCNGQYMPLPVPGDKSPFMAQGEVSSASPTLFGVFDGLGGEEQGEMAACIAAKTACDVASGDMSPEQLNALCHAANNAICQYASEHGIRSMGTTAAMLLFEKEGVSLCNIGDSKIFLFSDYGLQQISEDHLSVGIAGRKPPLLQNLGIPPDELQIRPFFSKVRYHDGDQFLICSDGLTDMVPPEELKRILAKEPFARQAQALLEAALEGGGRDNITILLCRIQRKRFQMKKIFRKREKRDGTYGNQ